MSERRAFEAKHYAMRKNRDGTVISFVVHPNDMTPELNSLPIGARVMIGWAEIGDDEKPKEAEPPKKRKFSEMSLPEQCGVRCKDGRFGRFLDMRYPHSRADNADAVRQILSVVSRAELSTNHDAANRWRRLETEFQRWLTDEEHGGSLNR